MPKIDLSKIPSQPIPSYPKEFAQVIAGREKQKLGDAVGLTQFGVNHHAHQGRTRLRRCDIGTSRRMSSST